MRVPMRPFSDEQLATRVRAGDAAAFDELYRRYLHPLTLYGARLLGDRSAGEDVAQAALMNAYQALRRGSEPRHVKAWLYRIAHNVALEQIERPRDVASGETGEGAGEDGYAAHTTRGELVKAFRSLPERQQRVYLLREVQGLRVDEIARGLGLTSVQVEQAMFGARNRLAEHLVFGVRLDCDTLSGLDHATLGRSGKRAVKAHLRSCVACRQAYPAGAGRGITAGAGLVPLQLLALGRNWIAALLGGGAAPAVKMATVAVVAAVAASPVAGPELMELARAEPPRAEAAVEPADVEVLREPVAWLAQPTPEQALFEVAAAAAAASSPRTARPASTPAGQPPPTELPVAEEPTGDEPETEEPPVEEEPPFEEEPLVEEEPPAEEPLPAEEPPAEESPVAELPPEEPPLDEPPPNEPPPGVTVAEVPPEELPPA